jgi:hypothetical protein
MPVTHDDLPHPVPPIAYLRYKENWFFLILDQHNDVFGAIHVVGEPGFDRIRYSVNLRIGGEVHDQPFTIVADLTRRFAHVPLHTESAGAMPFVYDIVENFAPLELKETGETGIGIVEVGWSTPAGT